MLIEVELTGESATFSGGLTGAIDTNMYASVISATIFLCVNVSYQIVVFAALFAFQMVPLQLM